MLCIERINNSVIFSTVEERGRGGVGDPDVGRRARVRVPAIRPATPAAHTRTFKPPPGQPLRQVWRQVKSVKEFKFDFIALCNLTGG